MKRYILIIIFILGLFFSFYAGYNGDINESMKNKLVEESLNQNYEFFLKFNNYYDINSDFNDEEIFINKILINGDYEESLSYNIIIKTLDEKYLEENNEITITLFGEDGSYDIISSSNMFSLYNIINVQISKEIINENCGDVITSIVIKCESDTLYSNNLVIDTSQLTVEYLKSCDSGFSVDEINNLLKVNTYTTTLLQIGLFICTYTGLVSVLLISLWVYKKKL